ncbi:MAG: sulfatase-like hydrolase/transferase [Akkermansiaceae bacterium]|nr:sulfatase-like hydrolase/transferase [Akkermansiaceae bacterium]
MTPNIRILIRATITSLALAFGASATPVTGTWLLTSGNATLTNTSTASPTWGSGSSDNANASSIHSALPATTALTNAGDKVVLSGNLTMSGVAATPGGSVFRFGLFNSNSQSGTTGWLGYFMTSAAAGGTGILYERTSGNTGAFTSSTGTFSPTLGTVSALPTGTYLTDATYSYSLSIQRVSSSNSNLRISTSLRRSDGTDFASLTDITDSNSNANVLTFDRVGFQAATGIGADKIQLSNVDVTFTGSGTMSAPSLSNSVIVGSTAGTATFNGTVSSDGGATVTARGFVYSITSTNSAPTIGGTGVTQVADASGGTGNFTSAISGLTTSTSYTMRAYATNSVGTSYGTATTFTAGSTTSASAPSLSNLATVGSTAGTATFNGTVSSDGGATVTARGFVYSITSTNSAPTIGGTGVATVANGSGGTGTFTASVTGLASSTSYTMRAYATNSVSTSYGTASTFTTGAAVSPSNSTFAITDFQLGPAFEPVGVGPTLRWNATSGRSYAVEGSTDLVSWKRIGAPVLSSSGNGTSRIGPIGAMPNFIRVRDRVASPDPALTLTNRPNVLFIAVDDLRPEIAAMGATYMRTPNMDALVQSGRAFKRHYVQCPTCGASRFAMMTSRRPTNGTAAGNDAFVSLYPGTGTAQAPNSMPEAFRNAGYTTESLGKISHYPGGTSDSGVLEMPGAWDRQSSPAGIWGTAREAFFSYAGGITRTIGVSPRTEIGVKSDGTSLDDTDYADGWIANDAIARLQSLKTAGKPFFFAVGFFKPHLPFNAPKKYWDLYDRNAITVPPLQLPTNVNLALTFSDNGEFLGNYGGTNTINDAEARLSIHGYRACVSYTDTQIGKVLGALTSLGLDQNTIVVLWGDHGWALGELGIWGKHTTLEESLKSPLVIRVPGMSQPGVASQAFVETVDIYPTLADLCNVPIPAVEGRSFAPALLNPTLPAKVTTLSYWNRNSTSGYSLRTDRYRLVRWGNVPTAPVQVDLFDYQQDPTGSRSVTSEQPDVASAMLKLLSP